MLHGSFELVHSVRQVEKLNLNFLNCNYPSTAKMEGFKIRKATKDDCSEILLMIKELAAFEEMPSDVVKISEETLIEDGFNSNPPFFHAAMADLDGVSVGYVVYYYCYSAFQGGQLLYLEDLYVKESYRGKGYGKKLLKYLMEEAMRQECVCMQWCVLNWNIKAIDFYKSLGAYDLTLKDNIHMYRLYQDTMKKLVA